MEVSFVVAVAENGVIGREDGSLPWHIRTDLQHYKQLTLGHPIIMGRKTHESIGKPLPGRTNIVITRELSYASPGCVVVHDSKAAIAAAEQTSANECFVIGGGQIYREMIPYVSTIYLTRVHANPEGTATFTFDESQWTEVESETHPADTEKRDEHAFTFITLKRK